MKRLLFGFLLMALLVPAAFGQGTINGGIIRDSTISLSKLNVTGVPSASTILFGNGTWGPVLQPDVPSSGTVSSATTVCTVTMAGYGGVGAHIAITGTATVWAEVSYDGGTTYKQTSLMDTLSGSLLSQATASGDYGIYLTGGVSHVRLRVTSYTSGSITGQLRANGTQTLAAAIFGTITITGNATSANQTNGAAITQIGDGTHTSTLDNTAPVASEYALPVRSIPRKAGSILTTSTLGSNAVYTGSWIDGNTDGTTYVTVQSIADQASASNGLTVQGSNDSAVSGFTTTVAQATTVASTGKTLWAAVPFRYWRVVYTNGASSQGSFELTATSSQIPPYTMDASGNLQVGVVGTVPISASSLPLPTGAAQDGTLTGGTAKTQMYDGTNVIGTSAHPARTDPTGTTTQPISAASLPLPSGASTSAKQPALGTAGTPSSDVITVQGPTSNGVSGTVSSTDTSSHTLIAAQGVGVKTYLTWLSFNNNTASTTVNVTLGGLATSFVFSVPPGGREVNFPTPVPSSANTAITITSGTGISTLNVNGDGFTGP